MEHCSTATWCTIPLGWWARPDVLQSSCSYNCSSDTIWAGQPSEQNGETLNGSRYSCGANEQESQGKRSSLTAVCHPHKEYLLPLKVLPFCSEVCPTGPNDAASTAITIHQLQTYGLDNQPKKYMYNQINTEHVCTYGCGYYTNIKSVLYIATALYVVLETRPATCII